MVYKYLHVIQMTYLYLDAKDNHYQQYYGVRCLSKRVNMWNHMVTLRPMRQNPSIQGLSRKALFGKDAATN